MIYRIPIPPRQGKPLKYPFDVLRRCMDSIYMDFPASKVYGPAKGYGLRHGLKFKVRREGNGCRVWLVRKTTPVKE